MELTPPRAELRGEASFAFKPLEVNKVRFFALDAVRAVAMLLGVVLHIITMGASLEMATPKAATQGMLWIHSFRMPLFFLLSGFFCRLMFARYGYAKYFKRRSLKLTLALLFALLIPIGFNAAIFVVSHLNTKWGGGHFLGLSGFQQFQSIFLGLGGLWFLWYLMVFATFGPAFSNVVGRFSERCASQQRIQKLEGIIVKGGMLPFLIALVALPARLLMPSTTGWSLGFASGITAILPEALWQYQPDWPYYFLFFMAGWWFGRLKSQIQNRPVPWMTYLSLGTVFYVSALVFEKSYFPSLGKTTGIWTSVAGCGLFSLGTVFTCFGIISVSEAFLNRPSRSVRYFSDRAFWIYLAHFKILPRVLVTVIVFGLPYWLQSALTFVVTILVCCGLYDLLVRRTFLSLIFGATASGEKRQAKTEKAVFHEPLREEAVSDLILKND